MVPLINISPLGKLHKGQLQDLFNQCQNKIGKYMSNGQFTIKEVIHIYIHLTVFKLDKGKSLNLAQLTYI